MAGDDLPAIYLLDLRGEILDQFHHSGVASRDQMGQPFLHPLQAAVRFDDLDRQFFFDRLDILFQLPF